MSQETKLYTFWSLWNDYKIEFPKIQRDYAQGRLSPHATEVREKLLDDIYNALAKNKPMSLDFVYGTIKDDGTSKTFIPLDGQQRLTTLFLLHWYIFYKCEMLPFQDRKFSYETRDSSKDFCLYMTTINLSCKDQDKLKISEHLIDQNWFLSVWLEDPTVKGMLVMLDAIEEKLKGMDFKKLSVDLISNQTISFFMLSLDKDFSLADDLYIKMNARGLALTTFENFKASLAQLFKEDEFKTVIEGETRKNFFKKLDMKWTNLFWRTVNENKLKEKKLKGNVDSEMMRFIRMILSFNYALEKNDNDFNPQYFNLLLVNAKRNFAIPEDQLSFYRLKEMGTLTQEAIKMLINSFESIDVLFDDEGRWKNDLDKVFIDIKKEWIKFIQSKSPDYDNQLIIYAIILCLQKNDEGLFEAESADIINDNIKEWLRLVRNIVRNTITDNQDKMRIAIISLDNLFKKFCKNVKDLSQLSLDDFGYFKKQGVEEVEKYNLMKNYQSIKNSIITYENSTYLEGQIRCLIEWAKDNGIFDETRFEELGNQLLKLFEKQDNKHYIECILLTNKLNGSYIYPYQYENSNIPKYWREKYENGKFQNVKVMQQFTFANLKNDRDYSWRRLLNDDPNDYSSEKNRQQSLRNCQELFKEILEKKHIPITVIDVEASANPDNWTCLLSKNPSWFDMYHTIYRVNINNKDEIYLSKGGIGKFFNKKSDTILMENIK